LVSTHLPISLNVLKLFLAKLLPRLQNNTHHTLVFLLIANL